PLVIGGGGLAHRRGVGGVEQSPQGPGGPVHRDLGRPAQAQLETAGGVVIGGGGIGKVLLRYLDADPGQVVDYDVPGGHLVRVGTHVYQGENQRLARWRTEDAVGAPLEAGRLERGYGPARVVVVITVLG